MKGFVANFRVNNNVFQFCVNSKTHVKDDKSSNGIIVTNSKDIDIYQCINEEHNNACKILLLSMYYFLLHRLRQLVTHALNFRAWKHGWILVYFFRKNVDFLLD